MTAPLVYLGQGPIVPLWSSGELMLLVAQDKRFLVCHLGAIVVTSEVS